MNFATSLTHVEQLSYYDRPLLEHWRGADGQDFLMVWQDEDTEKVTWLVIPVSPTNLAAFLEKDLDKAITLRELMLREDLVHPLYRVQANSFVYNVCEGEPVQLKDIGEDMMPLDGSYCHTETYVAWEARKRSHPTRLSK